MTVPMNSWICSSGISYRIKGIMKSNKESAYPTTTLPEFYRSIKNKRITKLVRLEDDQAE